MTEKVDTENKLLWQIPIYMGYLLCWSRGSHFKTNSS